MIEKYILKVRVTKITFGEDGFIHLTLEHDLASNNPTLRFLIPFKEVMEILEEEE